MGPGFGLCPFGFFSSIMNMIFKDVIYMQDGCYESGNTGALRRN